MNKLPLFILIPILIGVVMIITYYARKFLKDRNLVLLIICILFGLGGIGEILYKVSGTDPLRYIGQMIMFVFVGLGLIAICVGAYQKTKSDPANRKTLLTIWAVMGTIMLICLIVLFISLYMLKSS